MAFKKINHDPLMSCYSYYNIIIQFIYFILYHSILYYSRIPRYSVFRLQLGPDALTEVHLLVGSPEFGQSLPLATGGLVFLLLSSIGSFFICSSLPFIGFRNDTTHLAESPLLFPMITGAGKFHLCGFALQVPLSSAPL